MKTRSAFRRAVKPVAYSLLRKFPKGRLAFRRVYQRLMGNRYHAMAKRTPVDSRIVFFESFQGRSIGDSPKAIYDAMKKDPRFADYILIWGIRDQVEIPEDILQDYRTICTLRGSEGYFDALAMARCIVMNMRLPEYLYPKKDQVFVQCWHGTPLKRLANDIKIETANALNTSGELGWRYSLDSQKWSYLLSASPFASDALCSAFALPDEMRERVLLEIGDPGNDILVQSRDDRAARDRAAALLGVPEGKRTLLYAPTWRDDRYVPGEGYQLDYLCDMDALQQSLGDDWVVLFRAHYFIANQLDFSAHGDFVIDVSHAATINDCYLASDVMVTDYSSVMFDYVNLHRPLMLFVPDLDHYASDIRGFYFDINEVPGPLCKTTEQLASALEDADSYFDTFEGQYQAFLERFCPLDDGHASERVLETLAKALI